MSFESSQPTHEVGNLLEQAPSLENRVLNKYKNRRPKEDKKEIEQKLFTVPNPEKKLSEIETEQELNLALGYLNQDYYDPSKSRATFNQEYFEDEFVQRKLIQDSIESKVTQMEATGSFKMELIRNYIQEYGLDGCVRGFKGTLAKLNLMALKPAITQPPVFKQSLPFANPFEEMLKSVNSKEEITKVIESLELKKYFNTQLKLIQETAQKHYGIDISQTIAKMEKNVLLLPLLGAGYGVMGVNRGNHNKDIINLSSNMCKDILANLNSPDKIHPKVVSVVWHEVVHSLQGQDFELSNTKDGEWGMDDFYRFSTPELRYAMETTTERIANKLESAYLDKIVKPSGYKGVMDLNSGYYSKLKGNTLFEKDDFDQPLWANTKAITLFQKMRKEEKSEFRGTNIQAYIEWKLDQMMMLDYINNHGALQKLQKLMGTQPLPEYMKKTAPEKFGSEDESRHSHVYEEL
jgi:hypothetical protein